MILAILSVSGVLLGLVLALHHGTGIPIGELIRDPNSIGGIPPHAGFLSQLGLFLWAAAATVCFFSVLVLPKTPESRRRRNFLIVSGLLTLLLGLDDAFLLHEKVLPHFGVPQNLVLGGYLVLSLLFLIRFRVLILSTEPVVLAMALFFFGVSVGLDVLHVRLWDSLLEDGAKLIGIVAWLAYFVRVAVSSIRSPAVPSDSTPAP